MKTFNKHNQKSEYFEPNVAVLETDQSGGFLDKIKSSISNVSKYIIEAIDKALDKAKHSDVAKTAKAVGFSVALALAPACASGDESANDTDSESSIDQVQKELKVISEGFYDDGFKALFEPLGEELEVGVYLNDEYIGPAFISKTGEFTVMFSGDINRVAIEHNGDLIKFTDKDNIPDLF